MHTMNNLGQINNQFDLKEILQVEIKPLQSFVKVSKQNEIKLPVMIDIRTHHEKTSQKEFTDGESTQSSILSQSTSQITNDIERYPLDLIFVIDLSISMRGKKMAQLRKTISNLMNFLNENDRMAIIGFNNCAQNLFSLSNLTQQNKKKIMTILNSLLPMGLTNITVGLLEGLKQLEASQMNFSITESGECDEEEQINQNKKVDNFDQKMQVQETEENQSNQQQQEKYKNFLSKSEQIKQENNMTEELGNSCINFGQKKDERVKSIFLLSDGLDDRCEKNLSMLRTRIQSMQIQFSLNTFGYGEQHDAFLMSEIAGFKEGNFYYIEDIEKTDLYFADALGGLFSVVGNQLEFEFQLSCSSKIKEMTISEVYGDMWTAISQDNKLQKRQELNRSSNEINTDQKNKINLSKDAQLSKINSKEIIQSRSFYLNQVYLGVSKQILLEITIPQQMDIAESDENILNYKELNEGTFKNIVDSLNNHILATGILKMKDLQGKSIQKVANLEVNILDEKEEIGEKHNITNEDVEINYLRVQCAQALQDSMNSALKNEFNESQQIINRALEMINKTKVSIQKYLVNLKKDLEDCLEALTQKMSQQSSNPNSQSQLSYNSSHSTQDQNNNEQEKAHKIRRAFLCKSRAYMEQKSIMINLDEYQNTIQKNIKKQIEIQNQKKVFSAEEEEKEVNQKPVVKAKKILIPLQRKKFSSMNVGVDEISSLDEQK